MSLIEIWHRHGLVLLKVIEQHSFHMFQAKEAQIRLQLGGGEGLSL